MHKRCREIMDELILSGELEEINWFEFAPKEELKLRLKDMLEDEVDEKYLLNQELVSKYLETGTASNHKGSQAGKVADENDVFHTVNAGSHGYSMGYVKTTVPNRIGNIFGDDKGTGFAGNIWDTNSISPALTTMQGGYRMPLIKLLKNIIRRVTPRECFRLQGFDDSFIFPLKISDTQLYKQAGNGMSRNILDMIFTQIFTCYSKHIEKQNEQ